MYKGVDMTGASPQNTSMDWDFVDHLRWLVSVKFLIERNRYSRRRAPRASVWIRRRLGLESRRSRDRNHALPSKRCPKWWPKSAAASGVCRRRIPARH
jgi:hypothetical protein